MEDNENFDIKIQDFDRVKSNKTWRLLFERRGSFWESQRRDGGLRE